jgi:bifunctional DNA-binding transcriptional regulator/antitoxin component of YhaV-PrlF toxin-antitoxin module
MESSGFVKSVDRLGRFKIPKAILKTLKIKNYDSLDIYKSGNNIVIEKHIETCIFCKNADTIHIFKDTPVCASCLKNFSLWRERQLCKKTK